MEKIKFMLAGCDISFIAEAPADMTVKQLVKQTSRINPWWCDCGVHKMHPLLATLPAEILFDYDDVSKANSGVECDIKINIG